MSGGKSISLTPQQRARRWLPPQQRFVAALGGWQVQRRHLFLRRLVFVAAIFGGLAAWWLAAAFLTARFPRWAGWPSLLGALLVLLGSLWTAPEQKSLRAALLFVFFPLLGLSAGLLEGVLDTKRLTAVCTLVAAPPLGSAINLLFFRRQPKPESQLLLAGPWLAAAVAVSYHWLLEPLVLALSGAAGLLLAFVELRTAPASLAVRSPAEYMASAADIPVFFTQSLLGPLRGE